MVVVADASAARPAGEARGEIEPNDTRATATAVTLAATPGAAAAIDATLTPRAGRPDEDRFAIRVGAGGDGAGGGAAATLGLALELRAEVAATIEILDGHGQPEVRSSGAAGEVHGFPKLVVAPGDVRDVRVVRAAPAGIPPSDAGHTEVDGAYWLAARVEPLDASEEREPNDSSARATDTGPVGTGIERFGVFGWRGDVDRFRVPLDDFPAGVELAIALEPGGAVAAEVVVETPGGVALASSRGGAGRPVTLRAAPRQGLEEGVAAPPETVVIVVRAVKGAPLPWPRPTYRLNLRPELAEGAP